MTRDAATLEAIVEQLSADGLVAEDRAAQGRSLIDALRSTQPWYVRAMVGFGAWLASLLLIGFIAGFGLAVGGSTLVGLALLVGAVLVRRQPQVAGNDFLVQSTLATSLAGQALFAWGVAELLPASSFEAGCVVVILLSSGLFVLFPDRVHRVLMVLLVATALMALLYAQELNGLVPVIGPVFAGAFVLLNAQRARLISLGYGRLALPLESGAMLSAFGCLLLSTVYVLPELIGDYRFYPRPWISTLLLGALLLYVGGRTFARIPGEEGRRTLPLVYLLLAAVIAAAWLAPGLLLALLVVLVGAAAGHRSVAGVGIAFLAVFVATYFYGIEITLLQKSVTLIGSGAAILVARWLLVRALGGADHG